MLSMRGTGAALAVSASTASRLVTLPWGFEAITRKRAPSSAAATGEIASEVAVAPARSAPSRCQRSAVAPSTSTEKVAVSPIAASTLAGWSRILGSRSSGSEAARRTSCPWVSVPSALVPRERKSRRPRASTSRLVGKRRPVANSATVRLAGSSVRRKPRQ